MENIFDFTLLTDAAKAARIEKLRQSIPIQITGGEVPYSEDLKQYRKNAMEYGKTLRGEYINRDTGNAIILAASGVKEVLEHDYKDIEHLQSVAAVPHIIENSIYITAIKNENNSKNADVISYEYYVVGLKIGNIDYTVKAVVVNGRNGERYYDHKLTQIEKNKLIDLINQSVKKSFVSSGLSSTGELGESKTTLSGDQKRETTTSPVSKYKDKRLFSILQIKIPNSIGGVELSDEQRHLLALCNPIKLNDIIDKQGKTYPEMYVKWDIDAQKLCMSVRPFTKANMDILEQTNARFNAELAQQINGALPQGHVYQLGLPMEILQSVGIPVLPIEMTAQKLSDKSQKRGHEFDVDDVKDLPNFINNPVGVFAYGNRSKAVNIITEIDKNGKKFLVGIALNPEVNGKRLEVNSIRSIFPKHRAEWLNWITQGKTLYLNKEKIKIQIEQQRTNLADVPYLDLELVTKIVNNFQNPKILEQKEQKDLVKTIKPPPVRGGGRGL